MKAVLNPRLVDVRVITFYIKVTWKEVKISPNPSPKKPTLIIIPKEIPVSFVKLEHFT
jgi:hypothetical protein